MTPILQVLSRGTWMTGLTLLCIGCGENSHKRVYFGNLEDGSNVESPFRVEMKAENLIVEPASLGVNEGHGHFHIIIDAEMSPNGAPIPKDSTHIHFGQGETETVLDLSVGQHTLTVQFATGDHVPYKPQVAQKIQINVTKRNPKPASMDSAAVDSTAAAKDTAAGAAAGDSAKPPAP